MSDLDLGPIEARLATHQLWQAASDVRDLVAEVKRLLAALAAAEERERRVEDLRHQWRQRGAEADSVTDDDWAGDGWRDMADELSAALPGEGAADQPRPFHSLLTTTDRNAAGTLHLCTASCGWGWRSLTEDEARGKWSDAHTHGEGTR